MPGTGLAAPQRVALGENSRVMIGGSSGSANGKLVRVVSGGLDLTAGVGDATDNMSGGYTEKTRGPRNLSLTMQFLWRAADNPVSSPILLAEGEECGRVIVWPDWLNDPNTYYKMPNSVCEGLGIDIAGAAQVSGRCTLSNQGQYYSPAYKDPGGIYR